MPIYIPHDIRERNARRSAQKRAMWAARREAIISRHARGERYQSIGCSYGVGGETIRLWLRRWRREVAANG